MSPSPICARPSGQNHHRCLCLRIQILYATFVFTQGGGIVNCPTRQSTCYCSLGLSIDCLVGSGDLLFGGVDCIGNHAGKKWPIWVVNYFANFKNYMSQDVEFRCYHLVFGVFCHQIHVKKSWISEIDGHLWCVAIFFGNSWTWWEHCVLREQDGSLQISENDGYIVAIIFGNSSLYMAIIFRNSWIRRKMDLFCSLKSDFCVVFFVFQPRIYFGRWNLPKTAPVLADLGPLAPFVIYSPIYGVTTLS